MAMLTNKTNIRRKVSARFSGADVKGVGDIYIGFRSQDAKLRRKRGCCSLQKEKSNRKTLSIRGAGRNSMKVLLNFTVPSQEKVANHRVFIYQPFKKIQLGASEGTQ